jgi:hypothetical protein
MDDHPGRMRRFAAGRGIVEGQHLAAGPASANTLLARRMSMTTPSDPRQPIAIGGGFGSSPERAAEP